MMVSKFMRVRLLFLMFVFLENFCRSEGCWEEERLALLKLKHFFNDPTSLTTWVDGHENSDCCQWESVECNNITGRVNELDLAGTRNWKLGEWYLNASLFTPFKELEHLDLMDNKIAGCIDDEELDLLNKLEMLDMSGNEIDKFVVPKEGLRSLRHLYLSLNQLREINLGNDSLTNLEVLDLRDNMIDKFLVPKDSLSNLEVLDLSDNMIDKFLVAKDDKGLKKLNALYLMYNNLTRAAFAQGLDKLTSLEHLDLSKNRFNGTFDVQELDPLNKLKWLDMRDNEIDKFVVPKGLETLTSLKYIYLSNNQLREINLGNDSLSNLEELDLSDNMIDKFLVAKDSLSNLEVLDLRYNMIDKFLVPKDYKGLKKLIILYLMHNNLTRAAFTQGLCELMHLEMLYLNNNDIGGSLPWCLANMTSLQMLDVSYNQLTGNISSSPLIHLTFVQQFTLSGNHFQIPISLKPFFNHSNLKSFYCNNNQFYAEVESHSLPPKFQLNYIYFSGQLNGGTFPKFLYHQHDLKEVHLSHLNLTGEFPKWLLENNTNLKTLNLVNNSLSGSILL